MSWFSLKESLRRLVKNTELSKEEKNKEAMRLSAVYTLAVCNKLLKELE